MSSRLRVVHTLILAAPLCACSGGGGDSLAHETESSATRPGHDDAASGGASAGSTAGPGDSTTAGDPSTAASSVAQTSDDVSASGDPSAQLTSDGSSASGTTYPSATDGDTSSGATDGDTTGDPMQPCTDDEPVTFDYIWIANSSQGTVSKINTETGVEEARYRTAPSASEPSRTSVNQFGDVAVSNRSPGSVTKISAVPQRCVDKNNNGQIDTSTGANDIRPWGADECVLWNRETPSVSYNTGPRPTAWEGTKQDPRSCVTPVPRLWIGFGDGGGNANFWRLAGDTGEVLDSVTYPGWSGDFGPYGGAVNAQGDLYVIGIDNAPIVHIDAETLATTKILIPTAAAKYGVALDADGDLWISGTTPGNNMFHYDVAGDIWTALGNGGGNWILGVAVDQEGRVWGAGSGPCRLVEASVDDKSFVDTHIELPACSQPWGVSVDDDGYVWVVDKANKAYKVDPDTHEIKLIVTGLIDPYTYSDMTGQGLKLVTIE